LSFLNHIEGKIQDIYDNFLILTINNIGLRIKISDNLSKDLKNNVGKKIRLYLSEILEEREISIYGFLEKDKRDFFERLLKLTGVGVRLALKIVDYISIEEWQTALDEGRWEILDKVPGVGKKIAQRIFFEAKKTIPKEEREDLSIIESALINLGYTKGEIEKIIKELSSEKERDPEKLLKKALDKLKRE
jgi:Holliday junction DNA helicase RuvA